MQFLPGTWFTFFHEAGHVLQNVKKEYFLEGSREDVNKRELEEQANVFAANILIPPTDYGQFVQRGRFSKDDILEFANQLGIAPGIVVGRLQFEEKIKYRTLLNDLKRRFEWAV